MFVSSALKCVSHCLDSVFAASDWCSCRSFVSFHVLSLTTPAAFCVPWTSQPVRKAVNDPSSLSAFNCVGPMPVQFFSLPHHCLAWTISHEFLFEPVMIMLSSSLLLLLLFTPAYARWLLQPLLGVYVWRHSSAVHSLCRFRLQSERWIERYSFSVI